MWPHGRVSGGPSHPRQPCDARPGGRRHGHLVTAGTGTRLPLWHHPRPHQPHRASPSAGGLRLLVGGHRRPATTAIASPQVAMAAADGHPLAAVAQHHPSPPHIWHADQQRGLPRRHTRPGQQDCAGRRHRHSPRVQHARGQVAVLVGAGGAAAAQQGVGGVGAAAGGAGGAAGAGRLVAPTSQPPQHHRCHNAAGPARPSTRQQVCTVVACSPHSQGTRSTMASDASASTASSVTA